MPPTETKVWTTTKKIMGNLLPLILASPALVFAVLEFARHGPSRALMLWLLLFLACAWLFLVVLGLFGNGAMKRAMGQRMHNERPFDKTERYFVGFSRPSYKSALDPHEDVGFLVLHEDRLEFWGGEHRVSLDRRCVTGVRFRPNTHSIVGLGRWVSIEAVVDEKPVRMLIEPREKATLLGTLLCSKPRRDRRLGGNGAGPPARAGGPSVSC